MNPGTLLVVDDNPANRDLLSRRLERKGFSVLEADGGQRALDILSTLHVDLVLLDIMMPGIPGLEVLKRVRKTRSAAELPVIMVTARTDSEDIVEALGLGANDYVTKPIDFPVVLARVQAHLRTRRAATPAGPIQSGLVLAGRYRLESKIGGGNFGAVYQATHLELEQEVAVKVLSAGVGTDPEALARFRREGVSACRVKHANAVSVLDFGATDGGVAYLVMELLEGRSLEQEMREHGPLSPARCAEVLVPVCGALAEAHRCGIVHRDVKPSNIFLHRTPRGEVPKVLDFGIARIVGESAVAQSLTVEGTLVGTPAYMAPERFRDQACGAPSDVYSLGVSLFELLTARLPFMPEQHDPMALAMMHATQAPPSLLALNPRVGPSLEAVVRAALRKLPEQRPTAEEMGRDLAAAVARDAAR